MAVNELPIERKTFKYHTTITYDPNEPNGSALAGQDLAVEIPANDTVRLARAGMAVGGKLVAVFQNGYCTVDTFGQDMAFLQGVASGTTLGMGIVGSAGPSIGGQTNGYVSRPSNADSSTGRDQRSRSRGIVTAIESNTAGGTVRVIIP